MTIPLAYVGIDISKATLDIFDTTIGRSERIANASEPIARLVRRWRGRDQVVLFEATGPYDRRLRAALAAAELPFVAVNPARARDFARAAGYLAKTDAVDARMLAAMAKLLPNQVEEPRQPERERLLALHRRRDQLVSMRAMERARLSEALDEQERHNLARHIAWLDAEVDGYDARITALIDADQQIKQTYQRLRSVPGIGPVAATTLLALMPELGTRSRKTIAALAGLAPLNRDSGQLRGSRHIGGGRKRVRDALYMAALAARRACPRFKATYQAMIEAGKAPKIALIAIARKLLVILNAIERQKTTYAP